MLILYGVLLAFAVVFVIDEYGKTLGVTGWYAKFLQSHYVKLYGVEISTPKEFSTVVDFNDNVAEYNIIKDLKSQLGVEKRFANREIKENRMKFIEELKEIIAEAQEEQDADDENTN